MHLPTIALFLSSVSATVMLANKPASAEENRSTVTIDIPRPVAATNVTKPPQLEVKGSGDTQLRSIKFSQRYPPGYTPLEKRIKKRFSSVSDNQNATIGEVTSGRIAAYLRGPAMGVAEAKQRLLQAGFRIITVTPIDETGELNVIVFTSDALEKSASAHNAEFTANLRLLVDAKNQQTAITNPLYCAKACMPDFDDTAAKKELAKLRRAFKGLTDSKEAVKYDALPHYAFMHGMPQFKDLIEVARGKNLRKRLESDPQTVFIQPLPNGAILAGINLSPKTQRFPEQIGTKNAALLPYPVLIKDGKAYIPDPKYYIAVMYPLLKMSGFMTIADVPDTIVNEIRTMFQKKRS